MDILTKWARSVITNLVGSHNALIPILVTNAFAATLPLFALPKMLDGFLSETHHSYLNCKIGTDTCRYWHIGVCLCILVPHLAFFKGLQPSLIRRGGGGVEGAWRGLTKDDTGKRWHRAKRSQARKSKERIKAAAGGWTTLCFIAGRTFQAFTTPK